MSSINALTSLLMTDPVALADDPSASVAAATAAMERALAALELEMPDLQIRHRDVFSYANAWAERHDALLRQASPELRAIVEQRLHRIGVRWGVASGVRMTAQFPAIKLPL